MHTSIGIPAAELEARRERLLEHVAARAARAATSSSTQHYIRYFTGFGFLATERPVVFAQSAAGEMVVFVPEFEVERVRAETAFERDRVVSRVPGHRAPDADPRAACSPTSGSAARSAPTRTAIPGILGYQGPRAERGHGEPRSRRSRPSIESMMVRKSEAEIELIRESARWCEHAHRLLQEYTRPGATEAEASLRAGHEATLAMLEALGDVRRPAGLVRRRLGRLPRPDRPAQLVGARRRAQHRVPSRATCSSPRRARRSGATTPSSSGR